MPPTRSLSIWDVILGSMLAPLGFMWELFEVIFVTLGFIFGPGGMWASQWCSQALFLSIWGAIVGPCWLPFWVDFGLIFRLVFGSALGATPGRLHMDLGTMLAPFWFDFKIILGDPAKSEK